MIIQRRAFWRRPSQNFEPRWNIPRRQQYQGANFPGDRSPEAEALEESQAFVQSVTTRDESVTLV
jgi:hypothetical protein